jgi:hypothetical protein
MPAMAAGDSSFWGSTRWSWLPGVEPVGEMIVESVELGIEVGPIGIGNGSASVVGIPSLDAVEVGLAI